MQDQDPDLERIKRKFVADAEFRRNLTQFVRRNDTPGQTLVDYLDKTLKSPRARALFEQARADEARHFASPHEK